MPARVSRRRSTTACGSPTVEFRHPGQPERDHLQPGEPLSIVARFEVDAPVDDPVFTLMIYDAEGRMLHGSSTASRVGRHRPLRRTSGEVEFAFDQIPLLDGEYAITLCVTSSDGAYIYDWHEQRYRFEVARPEAELRFGRVPGADRRPIDRRAGTAPGDRPIDDRVTRRGSASSSSTTTAAR